MNKILYIALILSVSLQAAANNNFDYSYLVTHPNVLGKEYKRCQQDNDIHCDVVQSAVSDFVKLVSDRQSDPQGFGKLMLASQLQLSNAEILFKQTAKTSPGYAVVKQEYETQQQKVNTLMAVLESTFA